MPHELDDIDIGIVNALQQDGRKSFRQIARDLQISTPTVQARYQRLVHIGLIKSISPIIDPTNLKKKEKERLGNQDISDAHNVNLKSGMIVQMTCDFCEGEIRTKPHVFKFANFERFFCCDTCKNPIQGKKSWQNSINHRQSKRRKLMLYL